MEINEACSAARSTIALSESLESQFKQIKKPSKYYSSIIRKSCKQILQTVEQILKSSRSEFEKGNAFHVI